MPRIRNIIRQTARSPTRRVWRPLNRAAVRSLPGHRRSPDDLSQALTGFARALRCHRRLARLAPRFFDSIVVDREARERDERRRWMESWEPLLDKVYGPSRDLKQRPSAPADYPPPLPGLRTQRAVERELAGWDFWMTLGRLALARHRLRRPHALPTFTQLARLLRIAFDFGRLACGLPSAEDGSR